MKFINIRKILSTIEKPIEDLLRTQHKEKSEYNARCKELSKDQVLQNEIELLISKAKIDIQRTTSCDTHVADRRGVIRGLETLRHRLKKPGVTIFKKTK